MTDLVGRTLGKCRIIEQIAEGGMATVYKAFQPSLERYVAVKILPEYYAHQPGFAERFTREAKAVAKLTHPHVLPIYDFGQEDELSYIVMQYVEAGTLRDVLEGPMDLAFTVHVIEQIADALHYAHEQGVVHRDVKPSNVLLDRGHWVLLSDFGLAKMVQASERLTKTGVGIGTPAYVAPEQGQGLEVDRQTDIYSLGIILYEMIAGRVPFEAETPMAVVIKHINEPLPLPHTINPDVPEPVERVILKALAKSPYDRFETAQQMAVALRQAVAELGTVELGQAQISVPTKAKGAASDDEGSAPWIHPAFRQKTLPPRDTRAGSNWTVRLAAAIGVMLGVVVLLALGRMGVFRLPVVGSQSALPTVPANEDVQPTGELAAALVSNVSSPELDEDQPPRGVAIQLALDFAEQNPPILQDDFADTDSGWEIAYDQHGTRFYADGGYVVQVPEVIGERNQVNVPIPLERPTQDFVLKADLVALEGEGNWVFGFRGQPDKALFAGLVESPNVYGISVFSPPEGDVPLSRDVVTGFPFDQPVEITLVARGPWLALFLNGEPVTSSSTDILRPGHLHFHVTNTTRQTVVYRLDNVRLWSLPLAALR